MTDDRTGGVQKEEDMFMRITQGKAIMKMKNALYGMVVVMACLWPLEGLAQSVELLRQFASSLRTFQADFVQEEPQDDESELFGLNLRTGRMALQRPGHLYWHYDEAGEGPQTLVVDGRALWIWDPDLEQVTVQPVEKVIRDVPLNWLLYDIPLESKFTIIPRGQGGGLHWFALKPKENTLFQEMEVGLSDQGVLTRIRLYQSHDRVIRVRFSNVRMNQPVPAHLFLFTPPQGADVVGEYPQ